MASHQSASDVKIASDVKLMTFMSTHSTENPGSTESTYLVVRDWGLGDLKSKILPFGFASKSDSCLYSILSCVVYSCIHYLLSRTSLFGHSLYSLTVALTESTPTRAAPRNYGYGTDDRIDHLARLLWCN